MVVQHNLAAMNSNRMLGVTTGQQAKSSEKLSSGYRINRAADDAAGLSISEKMRKQINGLERASTNAEDGVSAVQTAEGALTEVHSMLQRMNELAVQAANGTNSEDDRAAIQAEITQLTEEIDRVAETTKFNETFLLKGDVSGETTKITLAAMDAGLVGKLEDTQPDGTTVFKANTIEAGATVVIGGVEYTAADAANNIVKNEAENIYEIDELYDKMVQELADANGIEAAEVKRNGQEFTITNKIVEPTKALTFSLHVGADANMENKIIVDIDSMSSEGLGIKGLTVEDKDVADMTGAAGIQATYAIDRIAEAIAKVSEQRSALGAVQNRLEHTIANLDNVAENTTAAESRIRDTDMAEEMVEYSKNNILAQAGQSMLAQANQSTQGVLSLLQ